MGSYIKAATVGELSESSPKLVEINGTKIALVRTQGEYYAVANDCTHVGGPMCEGPVIGEQIVCPWHGAAFNFKTGRAIVGPARGDLACYAVRVVGTDIEIEI